MLFLATRPGFDIPIREWGLEFVQIKLICIEVKAEPPAGFESTGSLARNVRVGCLRAVEFMSKNFYIMGQRVINKLIVGHQRLVRGANETETRSDCDLGHHQVCSGACVRAVDVEIPKDGKPFCVSWAIRMRCNSERPVARPFEFVLEASVFTVWKRYGPLRNDNLLPWLDLSI